MKSRRLLIVEDEIILAMGLRTRLTGDMDGIAAASEIRRHHDVPVIFMSAYADEETQQRAAAAGPAEFLSKLTTDLDLHTAIETTLAGHSV